MSVQHFLRLVALLTATACAALAQTSALSVDTSSREEVRQFYRAIYFASEGVPMGWTGSYAVNGQGDTSAAYKEATRLRINFFRALAGVPAGIAFDPTYSAKDQQAALMLSANAYDGTSINLSHTPPTSWTYYTADGAEAAGKSNIAYGNAGPDAVSAYIADNGSNNQAVGHRRWLFLPQTLKMGTGDLPGEPLPSLRGAANAIWINDVSPGHITDPRPTLPRTNYVAYPPAGYIPYALVWPRWSFSLPGADFSTATVSMTRNGAAISTTLEPLSQGSGENSIVWIYDNTDPNATTPLPHPRPSADVVYTVTVSNVIVNSVTQPPFTYTVKVFDPDVASANATPLAITGNATPIAGSANTYTISQAGFSVAPTYQWRSLALSSTFKSYNADNGLDDLVATTSRDYDIVQKLGGIPDNPSYRLMIRGQDDQFLQLPTTFLVSDSAATLTFSSRLGFVTPAETAKVQVSTDDGRSWLDTSFSQAGTSPATGSPAPTENGFSSRTVSLAGFVNRTVLVRFALISGGNRHFVPDSTNPIGWFIDNIALTGVQAATLGAATTVSSGSDFTFTPAALGAVAIQARPVLFGSYAVEWGTVSQLVAKSDAYLANLSVRTGAGAGDQTLIVGFYVTGSKKLLVRGIGPGLQAFNVPNTIADPKLGIFNSDALRITENDSWSNDPSEFAKLAAFPLTPGSKDAAIITTLNQGSYTAQLSGSDGGTGVALVELYDAAAGSGTKLTNVSARTQVGTGAGILIAGFYVNGTAKKRLLIRGVGPALTPFGVSGALANPKLELYVAGATTPFAENDDWDAAIKGTFDAVSAFPLANGSKDAALVVDLDPGSYTAQVRGVGDTTGVALVEVYEVP